MGILGLLLPSILFVCPCAFALNPALDVSQYAHTAWKVRDGFFKSGISSIAQTPDGYLWLGTDYGLMRFDGVRAVPWQPPAGQHLPSDSIMGLLVTRDGTLWIGTLKGLASWKDGKLTRYAELDGRYIYALLEDRDGAVWVSGSAIPTGRLCSIRKSSVQCDGDDGSLGRGVFNLYEDSKGNLWAGVKDGLWRWRPGPHKFYSLPGNANGVQAIGEDADGALLVGWKGGIHRFVDGKTEKYSLPGAVPQFVAKRILRDRDGGLWIGTFTQGLVHIHEGRTDVFAQSESLSGNVILSALFEDQEGTIWVGTSDGLDRFRDFAVATFTVKQGLSDDLVGFALAARDGSVWLETPAGLNQWTNGKMASFGKRDGKLNGQIPISLFQDSRGRMWVSTVSGLGYLENERFISVRGIAGGPVHGIAEDTAGNLWIANQNNGLFRLSLGGEVQQIPWVGLGHKDNASALIADPVQGGLWLGFHYGGVAYFKDGRVRAAYTGLDGLGEGPVNTFRVDPDGALWAATDGGLSRLKNGRIATLNSKNGLPCDAVHWSIEDDIGSVWLYMPCGLARVARSELEAWARAADKDKGGDAKRIQATVFDSSDGVRTHGEGAGGYGALVARSSDGKLWFLPWNGVSVVDPRHLPFNKLPPPVHIEQLTADRRTYEVTPLASGSMPLPALTRDLRIDYTALSLVVPEKVLFKYKLEGFDKDWQDAGNRRQAFYTNLPPKNYTFRLKACNNSGVWNEAGTFFDFAVAPAYYQTIWFRALCVAAFLAVLWGLYQLRLQQLEREFNAGVDARVGERIRIARELHDSLLQGVQGLMFRLQAVRELLPGNPSGAMTALDTALDRGDKVIVEGRDTISDLRQSTVGDIDIARALTTLGEELAAQSNNGTAPCVRVLVEGKQRELNPMLRDEIYRIAREALRNAFRHSEAQKIEAEITYGDSEFVLRVRDDGIGMAPVVANQGGRAGHWGLPGMRERAKSFGARLEVWSEQGAGTEIELTVPTAVSYGKSTARHTSWFLRKKN